jgi:hypothetical protein
MSDYGRDDGGQQPGGWGDEAVGAGGDRGDRGRGGERDEGGDRGRGGRRMRPEGLSLLIRNLSFNTT